MSASSRIPLLLLLAAALPARAEKAVPASPPDYVHNEGVVSGAAERRLSELLAGHERATGQQFVVGLFRSLEGDSLEGFVNRLFKAWKVGAKGRDDGMLFCLFKDDRRWRIEVGYGLEGTVTDLEAAEVANAYGVPHFKAGDYDGGVLAIAEALAAKARRLEAPAPPGGARYEMPWGGALDGFLAGGRWIDLGIPFIRFWIPRMPNDVWSFLFMSFVLLLIVLPYEFLLWLSPFIFPFFWKRFDPGDPFRFSTKVSVSSKKRPAPASALKYVLAVPVFLLFLAYLIYALWRGFFKGGLTGVGGGGRSGGSSYSGGWSSGGGGGGWSSGGGGGFSGGGGSSGGGGASGSW